MPVLKMQLPTDVANHICCNTRMLLPQELLSAVPWPNDVLEDYAPVAAEALGSSSGSSRGPVLRMGLAEGTPHSILPDHLVSMRHILRENSYMWALAPSSML